MRIVRKINNSAAVAQDSRGKELIVIGKGIGFPAVPYELTDMSRIDRTFYDIDPRYFEMISTLPQEILLASAAPSNGSCLCIFLADAVDMQHQIEKLLIITAPILLLLQESRNLFSTDICFRVIIGQHLYHAATPRFALSTAH